MPFDDIFGAGSGAAVIFGTTGGVMEAALRSAYFLVTGSNPDPDAFSDVRGMDGWKEAKFNLASMYERGYGTARNMRKALGLYEESLALGMTTGEKAIHRVERAMQRKRMGVLLLGSAGALTAVTVLWQVARKILGGSR